MSLLAISYGGGFFHGGWQQTSENIPVGTAGLTSGVSGGTQPVTVNLTVTDGENQPLPTSAVEVAVSNSTQLLYTGPLSTGSVFRLHPGVYSFYAQDLLAGFNATVVNL